jgi:hypothetical protein
MNQRKKPYFTLEFKQEAASNLGVSVSDSLVRKTDVLLTLLTVHLITCTIK